MGNSEDRSARRLFCRWYNDYPEVVRGASAAVWRELLCDISDDMTKCLENDAGAEPQLLTAIME